MLPDDGSDGRRRRGLLVDFGGVLTTDIFLSFQAFCEAEGLEPDTVARRFREDPSARELLAALETAIAETLTPRQRHVLLALALNGVPIDVLAERLESTRGALYETLRDARRKLRGHLERPRLTAP